MAIFWSPQILREKSSQPFLYLVKNSTVLQVKLKPKKNSVSFQYFQLFKYKTE